MNVTSRTRGLIAASLVFVGLASNPILAQTLTAPQTITVNNVSCPTATVTMGVGTISINTVGCGTVATPPTISSLSVATGLPNTPVTITGTNFSINATTVTIGGVAAAIASNTGSVISTSVPASAGVGAGNVVVTVAGLSATSAFTVQQPVLAAPAITSVSPATGAAGTTVTISGSNFTGATVTIGGAAATFTSSATTITATVPSAAALGAGNVVVTVTGFAAATSAFTVLAPPPPTISSVSPASGAIGSVVTISGSGLTNATLVTIGGATATVTLNSATSITATVPANAVVGAGSVVVTTAVTPAATSAFTVLAAIVGEFSNDVPPVAIPNPSKQAFLIPAFHAGANGGGDEVRAYSMNPARCSTTPALTRSWQHNIDLNDYKGKNAFDFFALQTNESLSFKFTVGSVDAAGGFIYNDGANARVRPTFISITDTPCNFDASKLVPGATRDACFSTGINGQGVNWANLTTDLPASYCRLVKGKTYYMNLRFQDARPVSDGGSPTTDSCPTGNCGGIIQVL